jgi:hypothetical protein
MVKCVTVCIGTKENQHPPAVMICDKNGVDIFRTRPGTDLHERGDLVLTEDRGWMDLAIMIGVTRDPDGTVDWDEFERKLFRRGGDYYGSSDRYVCPTCQAAILWRV